MIYLASQLWIFAALAAVLGMIVGRWTCGASVISTQPNSMMAAGALLVGGLPLAFGNLVPGRAGFLLELALILFAAYVIGCCIGCLFGRASMTSTLVDNAACVAAAASTALGSVASAALAKEAFDSVAERVGSAVSDASEAVDNVAHSAQDRLHELMDDHSSASEAQDSAESQTSSDQAASDRAEPEEASDKNLLTAKPQRTSPQTPRTNPSRPSLSKIGLSRQNLTLQKKTMRLKRKRSLRIKLPMI